jgi:hypothetical protein
MYLRFKFFDKPRIASCNTVFWPPHNATEPKTAAELWRGFWVRTSSFQIWIAGATEK